MKEPTKQTSQIIWNFNLIFAEWRNKKQDKQNSNFCTDLEISNYQKIE